MSTPAKLVYIVDDEAGMRRALTRLLSEDGFEVRAFASAQEFLAAKRNGEVACLILDLAMPELDGLELQRRLAEMHAGVPIIFLTGHGDIPTSVRAIKAGAVDFLTKPVEASDLLRAIHTALAHAAERSDEQSRYQSLTPREREVMTHVVAGKLNKQIAADLGTGEQNIKVHRARVMEKLGAESLADLVRIAERLGI